MKHFKNSVFYTIIFAVIISFVIGCSANEEELERSSWDVINVNPPDSGNLKANDTITVRFAYNPGEVTASVGVVSGSGKTRTITGPFETGDLVVQFWWTNGDRDLSHALYYNVIPSEE